MIFTDKPVFRHLFSGAIAALSLGFVVLFIVQPVDLPASPLGNPAPALTEPGNLPIFESGTLPARSADQPAEPKKESPEKASDRLPEKLLHDAMRPESSDSEEVELPQERDKLPPVEATMPAGTLRIRVTDAYARRLKGVTFTEPSSDEERAAVPDEGYFRVTGLATGPGELEVRVPGYQPLKLRVDVALDKVRTYWAVLEPEKDA